MFKRKEVDTKNPLVSEEWMREDIHPLRLLGMLIRSMSEDLKMHPSVYYSEKTNSVRMLFMNTSIATHGFFIQFGEYLGRISKYCTIRVCGAIDQVEDGELLAEETASGYHMKKVDVSGRDFDVLFHPYIKVEFKDAEHCRFLVDMAMHLDYRNGFAVVSKRWDGFLAREGIPGTRDGYFYRYLPIDCPRVKFYDRMLHSLTVPQVCYLWIRFLKEGTVSEEFNKFMELIDKDEMYGLYKWRMGLKMAIEQLEIRAVSKEGHFEMWDKEENQLEFDYTGGTSAEKLLQIILFQK